MSDKDWKTLIEYREGRNKIYDQLDDLKEFLAELIFTLAELEHRIEELEKKQGE
jgi:hypothetical protein